MNRKSCRYISWAFSLSFFFSGLSVHAATPEKEFQIRTGVNVSHWLSQNDKRGIERKNAITKADFDSIAAMGFDHIRLPIDEVHLWDTLGSKEPEAFTLLHNAIQWAFNAHLNVIVDLHIIRSHYFNAKTNTLWTSTREQQRLVDMWRELSKELKQYPNERLAYELMNEAVAENPEDWNALLAMMISELRKDEPARKIVVGSNMWQLPRTFPVLKIPENDKNIILSFHYYQPMALTHHTAPWTPIAEYTGPVHYPGWTIDTAEYAHLSEKAVQSMRMYGNGYYDKQVLEQEILPAIKFAKEKNLPLYCGEFGVFPKIDEAVLLRWYTDLCAVFRENNIAFAHWCYKGDFPVAAKNGSRYKALVDILTAQ